MRCAQCNLSPVHTHIMAARNVAQQLAVGTERNAPPPPPHTHQTHSNLHHSNGRQFLPQLLVRPDTTRSPPPPFFFLQNNTNKLIFETTAPGSGIGACVGGSPPHVMVSGPAATIPCWGGRSLLPPPPP